MAILSSEYREESIQSPNTHTPLPKLIICIMYLSGTQAQHLLAELRPSLSKRAFEKNGDVRRLNEDHKGAGTDCYRGITRGMPCRVESGIPYRGKSAGVQEMLGMTDQGTQVRGASAESQGAKKELEVGPRDYSRQSRPSTSASTTLLICIVEEREQGLLGQIFHASNWGC